MDSICFGDLPDDIIQYIGQLSVTGSISFYLLKIGGYKDAPRILLLESFGSDNSFISWVFDRWPIQQYKYSNKLFRLVCQHKLVKYIPVFADCVIELNRTWALKDTIEKYDGDDRVIDMLLKYTYSHTNNLSQSIGMNGSTKLYRVILMFMGSGEYSKIYNSWITGLGEGGHIKTLKKMVYSDPHYEYAFNGACCGGHLNIVEWVYTKTELFPGDIFRGLGFAMRKQHTDVVKFLVTDLDLSVIPLAQVSFFLSSIVISPMGVEYIKWIAEKNPNDPLFDMIFDRAISAHSNAIAKWILDNTATDIRTLECGFCSSASHGNIEMLKLLYTKINPTKCLLDSVLHSAIMNHQSGALQELYDMGGRPPSDIWTTFLTHVNPMHSKSTQGGLETAMLLFKWGYDRTQIDGILYEKGRESYYGTAEDSIQKVYEQNGLPLWEI